MTRTRCLAALWVVGTGLTVATSPMPDGPLQPVSFTKVRFTGGFWAQKAETNRTATIPAVFAKNDETGRVDNFAIAGRIKPGQYKGQRYNDTDVYKAIEGASYSLALHPDPVLERRVDDIIRLIAAAQETDGYLFTARTADPTHPQPGIGDTRWSNLPVSHELYNVGHLYEAAVAHFEATGKRSLLDVALKNATLVVKTFGPERQKGFPGHQEIELAMVKLFRVTGDQAYLDQAKYFLDQRGRDLTLVQYPPGSRFAIYNDPVQIQAHKPVLEQDEAVGHAVRAMYMYAGMTDVAALTGADAYIAASQRLWQNVVSKKLYLTGGVGARHDRESFGAAYELPNASAYNETCAAIGNALWNHRMFLQTGDGQYLDVLERVIYNGVVSGVSLNGRAFFYPNPLASDGEEKFNKGTATRAEYFDVACCPGNICRFIPSVSGLVYAVRGDELSVNLYGANEADVMLAGEKVSVRQETAYPWDGAVTIRIDPSIPSTFGVRVRLPGWARNVVVPGDLYQYVDSSQADTTITVNGTAVPLTIDRGFVAVRRAWQAGDRIEVRFPMSVRRVTSSAMIVGNRGRVAVERGPLVYCAEAVDNGGRALNLVLEDGAQLVAQSRPDLLGGVTVVVAGSGAGRITLVPYFAWSNRGAGEMVVWMTRKTA